MIRRFLVFSQCLALLVIAVACSGTSAAPEAAPPPAVRTPSPQPGVVPTHRDLTYADGARTLDLYLPKQGTPAPVVIWLHGGSWVGGDKTPVAPVLLGLRDQGFAVAAVNYRLIGLSAFPAQLQDVKGSIRWLRAHASEYNLDPARIYLVGFSAGGHIASLAGLTSGEASLEGEVGGSLDQSSAVGGVVTYAGPSDIARLAGECSGCEVSPQFLALGCSFLLCGERGRAASPLNYVKPGAPPFLLLHGDADRLVPVEQSRLLDAALRAAGVSSRLIVVPGAEHGLLDANAAAATREFLTGLAGLGR